MTLYTLFFVVVGAATVTSWFMKFVEFIEGGH